MNLDDSVTVTCTITKGDLPVNIWWRFGEENKTSYNLTTNDGVVITRTSQKVSLLTIEAVKARHRGSYFCFAQNRGGVAQHDAYLAINGLIANIMIHCINFKGFCNLFHVLSPSKKVSKVSNFYCKFLKLYHRSFHSHLGKKR